MAWYNATGKENDKSLYENPVIDRCIFCGNHEKIKCEMTIVFSEKSPKHFVKFFGFAPRNRHIFRSSPCHFFKSMDCFHNLKTFVDE